MIILASVELGELHSEKVIDPERETMRRRDWRCTGVRGLRDKGSLSREGMTKGRGHPFWAGRGTERTTRTTGLFLGQSPAVCCSQLLPVHENEPPPLPSFALSDHSQAGDVYTPWKLEMLPVRLCFIKSLLLNIHQHSTGWRGREKVRLFF